MPAGPVVAVAVLAAGVGAIATRSAFMRRQGIPVGGRVIVRCSAGHLFTTLWVPGASFKAIRLGSARFQHCPVGHHFTLVRPVPESELTEQERASARQHSDGDVP